MGPMRQGSSVHGGGRDIVKRWRVMKQRFLSICTALALCLTLLPGAAWAAEGGAGLSERSTAQTLNGDTGSSSTATDDTSEENSGKDEDDGTDEQPPVADADGSEANPYQIGTAEELAAFRDKVNGSGGTAQNDAMPC